MVRTAALLLAAALLVPGCRKEEAGGDAAPAAGEPAGDEVGILRKFPAATSGGVPEATRTVVRDPVVWADLWGRANAHVAPVPKAPSVDFTKEMVAFASLGRKPTAGWSVEVVGARVDGGKLVLLVAEREPPGGTPVAAVETAPWHAVVLPKSDAPAEWRSWPPPK